MLEFDVAALERFIVRAVGEAPASIDPMAGGASTRRYLRVRAKGRSFVAMFVPDAAPEEVTSGAARARWPFLEVHPLLDERRVRVPAIVAESCAEGLLLIEDLGEDTLAGFIERVPSRREEVYRLAVRDLAAAQRSLA